VVDYSSSSSYHASESLFSKSGNEVDVEPAAASLSYVREDGAVSSASRTGSHVIEPSSSKINSLSKTVLLKPSDLKPAVGASCTTVSAIGFCY